MAGREGKKFQGKRIVDAKHPLTITVNEADIRKSKRANPGECAIAKCLIRDKHVMSARVGAMYTLIEFTSHFERYKTDSAAKQSVADFDNDGTFAEGDYKLLPIPPSRRLTGVAHTPVKGGHREPSSGRRKTRDGIIKKHPTRNIFRAKEIR